MNITKNRIKLITLAAALALPAIGLVPAAAASSNLISNGAFDSGVAGWESLSGNPVASQGRMEVTNDYTGSASSFYSAWYCAPVQGGAQYSAEADYLVPLSAPDDSGAGLSLIYFPTSDCSGDSLHEGVQHLIAGKTAAERGQVQRIAMVSKAPAGTAAVRVRLSAVKDPVGMERITAKHVVAFDNVSLVARDKAEPKVATVPDSGNVVDAEDGDGTNVNAGLLVLGLGGASTIAGIGAAAITRRRRAANLA